MRRSQWASWRPWETQFSAYPSDKVREAANAWAPEMRRPEDWAGHVQCGGGEGGGKPRLWQLIEAALFKPASLVIEPMLDFHFSDSYVSFPDLFQTLSFHSYYVMPPHLKILHIKSFAWKQWALEWSFGVQNSAGRHCCWHGRDVSGVSQRVFTCGFQRLLLWACSWPSRDSGPWSLVSPDAQILLADSDLSRYKWAKPLLLGRRESFSLGKTCLRTDRASVYGLSSWQWEE